MLKTLGILLKFVYNPKAAKAAITDIRRLRKSTSEASGEFGKMPRKLGNAFKSIVGGVGALLSSFKKGFGSMRVAVDDVEDALDELDQTVGVRASNMVRFLMRPATVMASIGAAAIKAGIDLDKVQRNVRVQYRATAEDMAENTESILNLASDLKTGFRDVGEVFVTLFKREKLPIQDVKEITTVSTKAAKVMNTEAAAVAEWFLQMKQLTGLQASSFRQMAEAMLVATEEGRHDFGEMFADMQRINSLITLIPKELRAKALPSIMQTLAVVRDSYQDAPALIEKAMRAAVDMTDSAVANLRGLLAGQGRGGILEEMIVGAKKGDVAKVMRSYVKAIQGLDQNALRPILSEMERVFGISREEIAALQQIDLSKFERIGAVMADSAKSADYLSQRWENSFSISDKFLAVLSQVYTLLSSSMEIFFKPVSGILDFMHETLKAITKSKFWSTLVSAGVVAGTLVVAFKTMRMILGVILGQKERIVQLAVAEIDYTTMTNRQLMSQQTLLGRIGGKLGRLGILGNMLLIVGAMGTIATLGDETATVWDKIGSVLAGVVIPAVLLFGSSLKAALLPLLATPWTWVLGAIAGGVYLIYSNWEKVKDVLADIWDFVKSIFSFVWDGIKGFGNWIGGAFSGIAESLWSPYPDKQIGMASGGLVMPQPGGVPVTVAEAGRPEIIADPKLMRQIIGTDDLVDAVWGAAKFIVENLTKRNDYGYASAAARLPATARPDSKNTTYTPSFYR